MNNKDFDLEQFVDMFDTAMNSDNPTVQKCFKNLLMVVALAHAEDKEKHIGPLRKLVNDVDRLNDRITSLEFVLQSMKNMNEGSGPLGSPYTTTPYNIWTTVGINGNGYVPPYSGATSVAGV